MITQLIMLMIVLCLAGVAAAGVKYRNDTANFWTPAYTQTLKGLFCIVIALVHTPPEYQNPIQDMIGSFAYIGVTFFFMTSAYGLKYGYEHKKDYLNHFWRNRLGALLIPMILVNILFSFLNLVCFPEVGFRTRSLLHINAWVKMLLLLYVLFYLVYKVFAHEKYSLVRDVVLCVLVMTVSIAGKCVSNRIAGVWPTECLGFLYGILLARYMDQIKRLLHRTKSQHIIALLILSGVLGVVYLKFKYIYVWGDYLLKIVLGMAILCTIFVVTGQLKIGNKASLFLGTISYEVYLIHEKVFALVDRLSVSMESGTFILLSLVLTFFISSGVYYASKPLILKIRNI